jgi:hypothetical protein
VRDIVIDDTVGIQEEEILAPRGAGSAIHARRESRIARDRQ